MAATKKEKPTPSTLSPQASLILDYMMARPERKITPLAAHSFLGVASLTARIADIRKAHGAESVSEGWEKDTFDRRFKAYWLTKEQIEEVLEARKAVSA